MSPVAQTGQSALVVCETCGMPVRVVFDAEGEIEKVLAVCGHVQKPGAEREQPTIDDLPALQPEPQVRYYAHYQDDGPTGPCGQSMSVTQPWNRLYVFDTPKAWLDFIHDVKVETARRNARVTGAWAEGDDHYDQVSVLGEAGR